MLETVRNYYSRFHSTFHDSSVIVFARINVMLGIAWTAMQGIDVSALKVFHDHPEYLVYYMIFANAVNEVLRRNGAEYHDDGRIR